MRKNLKFLMLALSAVLTACGGGGGSPGTTQESYSITLRAAKTQLPLNIQNASVGEGAYAPFSTTLYVDAKKGSMPIPNSADDKTFACNVAGGLDSGALYYLDGNPDHEKEVDDGKGGKIKVPLAYRSITLGANSGGSSFHFHAGDQAGTARITCSVTDPRDNRIYSASVDITVGGATQKAASVRVITQAPGYLGSRDNLVGLRNNVAMQAFVMDDANQPVPNSGTPNVQVSIRSSLGAATGARLIAGSQSGSVVQLSTTGGVALFSLSSGTETGPIVLELTTDRYDNNVANGIQDPVSALDQVYVVSDVATTPLSLTAADLGTLTNGMPFTYALEATGGVAPYTWVVSGLPAGLVASSSGVISGTPKAPQGTYNLRVTVVDAAGAKVTTNMTLKLVGEYLPLNPEDFTVNGCSGGVNVPCPLPNATVGELYVYAFSASVSGVTWEFSGLPDWLKSGTTGSGSTSTNGYISGTPKRPDLSDPTKPDLGNCGTHKFLVTAKRGVMSVTRQVSITVTGGIAPNVCP